MILNTLKDIGIVGSLDIAIMTLILYMVIVWFKRTKAASVLTGILIVTGIYIVTRQFNLTMTAGVFEKFFAVILIILVVVFQEELRHFFEEVALWSLKKRRFGRQTLRLSRVEVEPLVRTLLDLSRERIGALVVIRGNSVLSRHLDGGISLDGALSEPLLKSIFDPHSAGHDGAVIVEGSRVTTFAAHLPLSKNLRKIKDRGTRHAAALGLSEVSDALCLVVSEERGTISVARQGEIHIETDPEKLTATIRQFYEEVSPSPRAKPWEEFYRRNTREKLYALVLAIGLWFVVVDGAKMDYRSFVIPVSMSQLPDDWVLGSVTPGEIEVTFRGPRSAFYFNVRSRIKLYPDLRIEEGVQQVYIHTDNFIFPKGLILDDFRPTSVSVVLNKPSKTVPTPAEPGTPAKGPNGVNPQQ